MSKNGRSGQHLRKFEPGSTWYGRNSEELPSPTHFRSVDWVARSQSGRQRCVERFSMACSPRRQAYVHLVPWVVVMASCGGGVDREGIDGGRMGLDGSVRDSGMEDGGRPIDSGIADAAPVDAGPDDGGLPDAGDDAGLDAGSDAGPFPDLGDACEVDEECSSSFCIRQRCSRPCNPTQLDCPAGWICVMRLPGREGDGSLCVPPA